MTADIIKLKINNTVKLDDVENVGLDIIQLAHDFLNEGKRESARDALFAAEWIDKIARGMRR